jgi:hypothetical protein
LTISDAIERAVVPDPNAVMSATPRAVFGSENPRYREPLCRMATPPRGRVGLKSPA